jgi:hypothetical protein
VVSNNDDYPADNSKINTLLVGFLDLRVSELVTDNPENHESLQVTEENAQNLIQFFDRENKLITGVVVGANRVEGEGMSPSRTYVRLISSNDVYLAEHVPRASDSAIEYMDKELLTLELDDIEKVELSSQQSSYTLRTSGAEEPAYILDNMPEGRQLKESEARSLFSAFTNVTFQNVKKDSGQNENLITRGTAVCYVKEQISYTLEILEGNETYYLRASSRYLDPAPIVKENRVESDEELKAKEEKLLARDKAEHFTNKHRGWLYEIPQWKAEALTKNVTDLLEEIEKPEEAAPSNTE